MYRLFLVIAIAYSCKNSDFRLENERLKKENDSLNYIMSQNLIRPYIDNKKFITQKDSSYHLQLFAAINKGIEIDTVYLNGKYLTQDDKRIKVTYDDFGPIISFTPDSVGEYEFIAQTKIKAWGNRVIEVSWPLIVE